MLTTTINHKHLFVSGPDAKGFLQGQLTCDMEQISTTKASYGAHCNIKGRIYSFFLVYGYNDSYRLEMPTEIIEFAKEKLEFYGKFSKVKIEIEPQPLVRMGLIGNKAEQLLKRLQINNIPQAEFAVTESADKTIIRLPGKEIRFEIVGDPERMQILEKQIRIAAPNLMTQSWQLWDIQAGIPFLTKDSLEKFLPHEINLPALGAVSFNKGCFLGQEIVARMEHLGKIKKQMQIKVIGANSTPTVASKTADGQIVCCAEQAKGEYLALVLD